MRHTLIDELPSRLVNEYQTQGGDIMIIPVGSIDAIGPHLPVGARSFVAEAFSQLLAEKAGGLRLPVLPLTPVLGTAAQPGSIDVSEPAVNCIARALMDDLYATGFRRIVVVTYMSYLRYYPPQEFYEDHQVAAAGVHLGEMIDGAAKVDLREDSIVVGALKILGREDLVETVTAAHARWKGKASADVTGALAEVQKIGVVGLRHPKGHFLVPPTDKLDGDAGAAFLEKTAAEMAEALESLRAYNEYLARRGSRGLTKGTWFRS